MPGQGLEASRVQDMMWVSKLLFTYIPPIRLLYYQSHGASLSTATANSVFQLHTLPVHVSHPFPARTYHLHELIRPQRKKSPLTEIIPGP